MEQEKQKDKAIKIVVIAAVILIACAVMISFSPPGSSNYMQPDNCNTGQQCCPRP